MRRIRALIVLAAMACAVLAGSSSAVSAGENSVSAAHHPASADGKRWGRR